MVERIEDYKWSSYNEYINQDDKVNLIDSEFVQKFFRDTEEFKSYMRDETEDKGLEYSPKKRYIDGELKESISLLLEDVSLLQTLDKPSRDSLLKRIKETTGASNRQLSRVLKIGRGVLDKIKWFYWCQTK
ncbi:hypothetical protein [Alkaliphilus oremlandii]|uniref:hypothetical protein n=1 Tax=Alkaliphilus oremlandii TaxID=461876 RepID=UPI0000D825BD|nr:hypothetical protein [Alkaliphilus oremlandii]